MNVLFLSFNLSGLNYVYYSRTRVPSQGFFTNCQEFKISYVNITFERTLTTA